ncbi:MAG: hypothetical protein ACPGVI_05955 [Crocinitomicaceae bacterium]
MKKDINNAIFTGAENKKSLYDLAIPNDWNGKLVIFIHGYMGYKDWGCWNLVQDFFTQNQYGFIKYNVSHNGGTIENPIDFDDLASFSQNNYLKELQDFEAITNLVQSEFDEMPETDLAVDNAINRSIFSLEDTVYCDKLQQAKDNWQVATLPSIEDFTKFIKSFEPWLKEQYTYQAPAPKVVTNIPETQVTSKTSKPSAKNDMLLEELSAFDIVKFAENQGGAELAGLMLEQYVVEINELIEQLSNAISSADKSKADHTLGEMITLAKIIAAPDILQAISKIEPLLCELSSPMLANEMIELKLAHEKLTLASEAI